MNLFLTLTLHTANLLGAFNDPFEFAGNYGPEMNPIREKVFALDYEIEESNLRPASCFIKRILDKYAILGKPLPLSILGSTKQLCGKTGIEMERILLAELLDEEPVDKNLFSYWRHEAAILHRIADEPGLVDEINRVKEFFAKTLGDPRMRATQFRAKLDKANSQLLFTQESDGNVIKALTEDGRFFGLEGQSREDGTLVFLGSDAWEPEYEVLSHSVPFGKMNLLVATLKESREKFLLASAHGNSNCPEDGRNQIQEIVHHYHKLQKSYPGLQLLIGIDANTKSKKDVADLQRLLEKLNLVSTKAGPTTVKKRMMTLQKHKARRLCVDYEDFLITTKGGHLFSDVTVGFCGGVVDQSRMLPDLDNPSDHYPVGATLVIESQ